ncbi:hypothetical protein L596_004894 [Steinernema carpocapsae]|uniref:Uncharacterized protein n=1 Tax=Steinernema carpocapsae TaxID=34508 RepID=A0A4U8UXC1_STECR|nr:hypothetical protein L596_004894 [Steinernema carpocapsae]
MAANCLGFWAPLFPHRSASIIRVYMRGHTTLWHTNHRPAFGWPSRVSKPVAKRISMLVSTNNCGLLDQQKHTAILT